MKKITKILALAMILAIACITLASCAKISGTYENNGFFGLGSTELTFKGSKITVEMGDVKAEGTYKIDEDKITIEFPDENEDDLTWSDLFKLLNGEHDFEKGDDYIKIGGTKYTKAD